MDNLTLAGLIGRIQRLEEKEEDREARIKKLETSIENIRKKVVTPSKFKKPTMDELSEFIVSGGYNVDADKFYGWYDERGWCKSDGYKLSDWKRAVRQWHTRNEEKTTHVNRYQKPPQEYGEF